MNTALTVIYLIIGVIILTFLGYLIATNTPKCKELAPSYESELMAYYSDSPNIKGGGNCDGNCKQRR